MILPAWLRVAYIVLLVIGTVAGGTFVVRYMITYRWWTNDLGRHLVTFTSSLALLLGYSLLSWAWPRTPGRLYIGFGLFVVLIVALVWRLIMFERMRWKDKRGKR